MRPTRRSTCRPRRPYRVALVRGAKWDFNQGVLRTLDVVKEFGLDITILCWHKDGDGEATEQVDGMTIHRFRRKIPPRSVKLFLWWPVWWAWILWRLVRGRFHIVHAFDIETLVPASLAKSLLGYRLIYDCRDSLGLVLANVRWPVPQVFKHLERLCVCIADGMLISQGDLHACARFFGRRVTQKMPMVRMLNVPMTHSPPATYRTPTAQPLKLNVSGYISPPRGAQIVIDLLSGRDDMVCDVVGGVRYPELERKFNDMPNATAHGWVPVDRHLELMDQADLIWLHYDNALVNVAVASSNKMFESMMLGKPYITADGSWMAQIARKFGVGFSLPYGDTEGLTKLFEQANADPSILQAAGIRGRECYAKLFTWPHQRENLVRLYRHVVYEDPTIVEMRLGRWQRFIGAPPAQSLD